MAKRPIFVPNLHGFPFVRQEIVEFQWHPGFAKVQIQKCITSLHESAATKGITPILEISSKSKDKLGISLSAFNLMLEIEGNPRMSVECAYQGSKVFEKGGPYTDLYSVSSREAKTDERLKNSGEVVAFSFLGEKFPSQPTTAFYDWLYMTALWQNRDMAEQLCQYKGFSDIAFNPKRSINCQAHSAALFVSLYQSGKIENIMDSVENYIDLIKNHKIQNPSANQTGKQLNLF
jgi:hypothetical protein